MADIRTAAPGSSAPESTIAMLRDTVRTLRRHPRDPEATSLANRIHGFLARFPEHFVVEFLQREPTGRASVYRVPLSEWPEWATPTARDLGMVDRPAVEPAALEATSDVPDDELLPPSEIAALRKLRGQGMESAVGEYTPAELWDALDEIERLRARLEAAQRGPVVAPDGKSVTDLSPAARAFMAGHLRQLADAIDRGAIIARGGLQTMGGLTLSGDIELAAPLPEPPR